MKKFNIRDEVIFTIHQTQYKARIIEIDEGENIYKIHNLDTNSFYWVEKHRLSK